jgi:hypothetical protein
MVGGGAEEETSNQCIEAKLNIPLKEKVIIF